MNPVKESRHHRLSNSSQNLSKYGDDGIYIVMSNEIPYLPIYIFILSSENLDVSAAPDPLGNCVRQLLTVCPFPATLVRQPF